MQRQNTVDKGNRLKEVLTKRHRGAILSGAKKGKGKGGFLLKTDKKLRIRMMNESAERKEKKESGYACAVTSVNGF